MSMDDFEVHERGTSRELSLARELVNALDNQMRVNPLAIPPEVKEAYLKISQFYRSQMAELDL